MSGLSWKASREGGVGKAEVFSGGWGTGAQQSRWGRLAGPPGAASAARGAELPPRLLLAAPLVLARLLSQSVKPSGRARAVRSVLRLLLPRARCGPLGLSPRPLLGAQTPAASRSPHQSLPLLMDKCDWISKLHQLRLDSISLFSSQAAL